MQEPRELELDLLVSTTTPWILQGGTFEESQGFPFKKTPKKATWTSPNSLETWFLFFFLGGGWGIRTLMDGVSFFFPGWSFLPTNKSSPPQSCGRLNWNTPWRLSPFSRWEKDGGRPLFKWENGVVFFQRCFKGWICSTIAEKNTQIVVTV